MGAVAALLDRAGIGNGRLRAPADPLTHPLLAARER